MNALNALRPAHVVIVLLVIFLLFGARRIPELARAMAQSIRVFRSEVRTDADNPAPPHDDRR